MLRRVVVAGLLAIWSATVVAADPLTLILLRILRDQIITAAAQAAYESMQQPKPPGPIVFPAHPYDLDDARLRTLIDEGFIHLTAAQRDEVFAGVKRILADPKNAAIRFHIIEELAVKASAVRQAHEQLINLSDARKRMIAGEAREEYSKLAPEERQQMLAVLQSGVVPIPRDLNDMILAEFRSVPVVTVAPAATPAASPAAAVSGSAGDAPKAPAAEAAAQR
jgi:hypothetical protein